MRNIHKQKISPTRKIYLEIFRLLLAPVKVKYFEKNKKHTTDSRLIHPYNREALMIIEIFIFFFSLGVCERT